MTISSFSSMNGETWVLSDGFCVLGYFKSEAAAKKAKRARLKARKAR